MGSSSGNLRTPPQAPISFRVTPAGLIELAEKVTKTTAEIVDTIVTNISPSEATFDNVIGPFVADENGRFVHNRVIHFLGGQHPNKDIRDAAKKAHKMIADASIELLRRHEFFELVQAVREKLASQQLADGSDSELMQDNKVYVEKMFILFEENGATLPTPAEREHYLQVKQRIQDLGRKSVQNIDAVVDGVSFTRDELKGLSDDQLKRFRVDEKIDDKYVVSLKDPDVQAIAQYASVEETRRQVWLASQNKCPQNVEIHKEVFLLRDESARLLGYPDHATMKTKSAMIGTPQAVDDFLTRLGEKTQAKADENLAILRAVKAADNAGADSKFYGWDWKYYDTLRTKDELSIDESAISEYFSLDHTLDGMLKFNERLYGIKFERLVPEDDWIWHKDVRMFAVWSEQPEEFIGYFYCDLFPREGRFSHFSHFSLDQGYTTRAGHRHFPSSVACANFTKFTATKPSLLSYQYVYRLGLQVGHAMHQLLSKTRYATVHGLRSDHTFNKTQAKLTQKLLFSQENLKEISLHYSQISPEYNDAWRKEQQQAGLSEEPLHQLSDATVAKIIIMQNKRENHGLRSTLFMSRYDLQVHRPSSRSALESTDLAALFNAIRKTTTGCLGTLDFDGIESQGFSVFRLIMASFDAGYYTQLLSQVYACDLAKASFPHGVGGLTPEEVRRKGERYRRVVLEPGASRPEMEILKEFLGREPSVDAFFAEI